MTVPLDEINDIREMDAVGVPRAEIARRLSLSRNTVAKYADMADMSPAAPEARPRARRALGPEDAAWIDAVLEADLGAPRKQRHTAKRIYDRLVGERGYEGSYSTVQRRVRAWRDGRRAGAGYLELEWAPGTAQADFGNFDDTVNEKLPIYTNETYPIAPTPVGQRRQPTLPGFGYFCSSFLSTGTSLSL